MLRRSDDACGHCTDLRVDVKGRDLERERARAAPGMLQTRSAIWESLRVGMVGVVLSGQPSNALRRRTAARDSLRGLFIPETIETIEVACFSRSSAGPLGRWEYVTALFIEVSRVPRGVAFRTWSRLDLLP